MKTKSLRILSIILVLALFVSVTPSIQASAADFAKVEKIVLKVANKDAYKNYGPSMYCLSGEAPAVLTVFGGINSGDSYGVKVEVYKDHYFFKDFSDYGITDNQFVFSLPKLEAGRYDMYYTFTGKDIVSRTQIYTLFVMDKKVYNYVDQLYTSFETPKTEKFYSNAFNLSTGDVNARMVVDTAYKSSSIVTADKGKFVDALYKGILYRNPDEGGRSYWLGKLGDNPSIEAKNKAYNSFVNSYEFKNDTCKNLNIPW